jgi:hypothetical protein
MVKFSGKSDEGYEMIKDEIEELIMKAEQAERNHVSGMLA